jgi:hypothetical protein
MFVIVHNNSVILGPKNWNKLMFQDVILEDCEIECDLNTRNNDNIPIIINDEIKILPVTGLPEPEFNPKIQRLEGPYWNFYDDRVEMYFTPGYISVEGLKNFMKEQAASERYIKENNGITYTKDDQSLSFSTSREQRNIYIQNLITMNDTETINWKFGDRTWVLLTKQDFININDAVKAHVQSCFDWEIAKYAEIDAAITHEELDNIVISEKVDNNLLIRE